MWVLVTIAVFCGITYYFTYSKWWRKREEQDYSAPVRTDRLPDNMCIMHSFTGPQTYTLTVDTVMCSCPDWFKRRATFPPSDPRRLCKHLAKYYHRHPDNLPAELKPFEGHIAFLAEKGWGWSPRGKMETIHTSGGSAYLHFHADDSDWVNICMAGKKYGYHPDIERWAYGMAPSVGKFDLLRRMHDLPPGIPAGSITTVERKQKEPRLWMVHGVAEGVDFKAELNTRADWQRVIFGRRSISWNARNPDTNTQTKTLHLKDALNRWLADELAVARGTTAKKAEEQAEAAPVRTKLSEDEKRSRDRERKRAARAIVTTSDELEGFENVRAILDAALPDMEIGYTDRQKWFIIHTDKPTNWICRLHFNGRDKKMELNSGETLPVEGPGDLLAFQEKIVAAAALVAG